MNDVASQNGCTQCGSPCRFVLCNDCYAETQLQPLPEPAQTDSAMLWLQARAEGEARS
jgi:hypothetical protein